MFWIALVAYLYATIVCLFFPERLQLRIIEKIEQGSRPLSRNDIFYASPAYVVSLRVIGVLLAAFGLGCVVYGFYIYIAER